MPASILHYEFVKSLVSSDEKYFDIIALAGQGPDPFFFYGYSLKKRKNKKQVQEFGTLLHHSNIAPFYLGLLDYCTKKKGVEKEKLLAFIKGFMYHYCLDRNAHPYIFYISGFSDDEKEKRKYALEHAKVESALDALTKEKYKEKLSIPQMLTVSDEDLHLVSKMLHFVAHKVLNVDYLDDNSYFDGVKDMRLVYKILNSPLKIKKLLFMAFFKNHELNAMSAPLSLKKIKKYDLFNENNKKWQNCVNGNIRFESLNDLIENARYDANIVNDIIKKSQSGDSINKNMNDFVNLIDHDGFKVGTTKKYFKIKMSQD